MPSFQARRTTQRYCQTNLAPPEQIFPLLCPLREAEWLDGWQYRMIYSASGRVEKGCVFSTRQEGEEDTLWVVTRHDPIRHVIAFARFTPRSRICVLEIAVKPAGTGRSAVHIVYTYTGIAPKGNRFIDGFTREAFLEAVRFWEQAINHFLVTGKKLKRTGKD